MMLLFSKQTECLPMQLEALLWIPWELQQCHRSNRYLVCASICQRLAYSPIHIFFHGWYCQQFVTLSHPPEAAQEKVFVCVLVPASPIFLPMLVRSAVFSWWRLIFLLLVLPEHFWCKIDRTVKCQWKVYQVLYFNNVWYSKLEELSLVRLNLLICSRVAMKCITYSSLANKKRLFKICG